MKTKEELNALKEEIDVLNKKLADLTEEELGQVIGGLAPGRLYWKKNGILNQNKDTGADKN